MYKGLVGSCDGDIWGPRRMSARDAVEEMFVVCGVVVADV